MKLTRMEYAIRVKDTHCYLPRPQRRDGRGGSHLEPIDFSRPDTWPRGYEKNMQIRSYSELRAAKIFLASWLQGKFYQDVDYDGYEEIWNKKQEHRKAEDMEIVQITITLPGVTIEGETPCVNPDPSPKGLSAI